MTEPRIARYPLNLGADVSTEAALQKAFRKALYQLIQEATRLDINTTWMAGILAAYGYATPSA